MRFPRAMATPQAPSKRHPGSLFQPALSAFQPIASRATQLVRIRRRETPLTTRPRHAPARATRARGRALTFAGSMDPKGDDDNLEDLCMGTKRTYDEKLEEGEFELVGVNCGGDSFVEGDVLFTMYPKYELAY